MITKGEKRRLQETITPDNATPSSSGRISSTAFQISTNSLIPGAEDLGQSPQTTTSGSESHPANKQPTSSTIDELISNWIDDLNPQGGHASHPLDTDAPSSWHVNASPALQGEASHRESSESIPASNAASVMHSTPTSTTSSVPRAQFGVSRRGTLPASDLTMLDPAWTTQRHSPMKYNFLNSAGNAAYISDWNSTDNEPDNVLQTRNTEPRLLPCARCGYQNSVRHGQAAQITSSPRNDAPLFVPPTPLTQSQNPADLDLLEEYGIDLVGLLSNHTCNYIDSGRHNARPKEHRSCCCCHAGCGLGARDHGPCNRVVVVYVQDSNKQR